MPRIGVIMLVAIAALASAWLTFAALRYARWRRMLDQPGQRRSHSQATPRGGGIAIVLTMVGAVWWLQPENGSVSLLAFVPGLIAVAGVGWVDDHRPLSARLRLFVHLSASFFLAWWLSRETAHWPQGTFGLALLVLATLWLAICVNFWNFMDGSNGLVTIQSAFVALMLAVWPAFDEWTDGADASWPLLALATFGACLGFLPFNFPKARIFMGDVGSGGLGFACGALLLVSVAKNPAAFWPMLLPPSALLIDAALTLASRMAAGKNWTKPHREHLYQWLVRTGSSHAKVAMLYLAWGLFVTAPCLLAVAHWPRFAPWIALLELAAGALVWFVTRRVLLRRIRNG